MSKQKEKDWQRIKEACEQAELEETAADLDQTAIDQEENALNFSDREALESQLLAAEKKAEESMEKAIRASAELENVRRRAERDVENAHRFGVEKLVKELLPVIDSLEQALLTLSEDSHPEMANGIKLTMKLLLSALEKQDVVQLNPEGSPFNPQEHEAMSVQVSDEVAPNTVITVFQKGYQLSGRVIRPARVIVSKVSA